MQKSSSSAYGGGEDSIYSSSPKSTISDRANTYEDEDRRAVINEEFNGAVGLEGFEKSLKIVNKDSDKIKTSAGFDSANSTTTTASLAKV